MSVSAGATTEPALAMVLLNVECHPTATCRISGIMALEVAGD